MTSIFSLFTRQVLRKILGPMKGVPFPQEEIDHAEKSWVKMYEMMEGWLTENKFLCAHYMTMADVVGYEELSHSKHFLAQTFGDYPRFNAWFTYMSNIKGLSK
jgi:hypothetical protein